MDSAPHSTASRLRIAVAGGGVSGLTAALLLAEAGHRVTVYEAAAVAGGRLRSLNLAPPFDIGSHLMVHAYRATGKLLQRLGSRDLFYTPEPVVLNLRWRDREAALRFGRNATPWRSPAAFLQSNLFPLRERWRLLQLLVGMKPVNRDGSSRAEQLRQQLLNSSVRQRQFWELLVVSLFNTALKEVDPVLLVNTLHRLFRQERGLDPLLPVRTVSEGIIDPLLLELNRLGCELRLRTAVTGVEITGDRIRALVTAAGRDEYDHYLLALPVEGWCRLWGAEAPPGNSIATIYLSEERGVSTEEMTGFPDAAVHWLLKQGRDEDRDRYAAVISGFTGSRADLERSWLQFAAERLPGRKLEVEQQLLYRRAVPCQDSRFFCWRSRQTLKGDNWDSIGDWTHPELPATVEAAVERAQSLVSARFV